MSKTSDRTVSEVVAAAPNLPLSIAVVATQLAEALEAGNVLFAAANEVRGAEIAIALGAMTKAEVVFCPGSDALPGDDAPASPANVGQRVAAFRRVRAAHAEGRKRIACITTGEALARAYAKPDAYDAAPPRVAVGEPAELNTLFNTLCDAGYVTDERVDEPGEIALRGQVLDVFPADAETPIRVEAAEGTIVSIRSYDPVDQRTTAEHERQEIGRVAEPQINGDGVTIADHLPRATLFVEPGAEDRRRRFLVLVADVERRRPGKSMRDVTSDAAWQKAIERRTTGDLRPYDAIPRFVEAKSPLRAFGSFARDTLSQRRSIVLIGSARDLRYLCTRVARAARKELNEVATWSDALKAEAGSLLAVQAPVDRGFSRETVVAVAAADLLGSRAERVDSGPAASGTPLVTLNEIRVGDVVVHEDHGLGVVRGLEPVSESGGDAIALVHAGDAVRLVPVAEADRLWRYGADADAVTLDKLDGSTWDKRRATIDAAIAETAKGLIALADERSNTTAPVIEPDAAAYERFSSGFAFTETRDQAKAIEAVRADLASGKPMDRLVIGDVGYGKTEVALRAAALAALAGFQVALAAPTTVLARQHLETFTSRFETSGIGVAGLSRLSSAAEKKRVKAGLADGSIQIVVGTGAVAGKDIRYTNLGLVIIDEEQRFGAADKTRIRSLGAGHALSLSATPIPRTLQSALVGIQQMSVIATPPARRQPIRTSVSAFDKERVRAALLRERSRGGQSFVVVPRIEDMAPLKETLGKLVPELQILSAHGKLPGAEIDETMVRFGRGDGDVLLATNIIEAGLDVPRANTMIINRADRFGLSQLHQLRGRVGRGGRRGQVLLLTELDAEIAPRTLKRLRTLEAFDRLGAGFEISARDLDMRGAGDLLGEAQAGHMKLIGIDLYQHLLEAALRTARGETVDRWTPELRLGVEGRLDEEWIPDPELRVTFYVRLARAQNGAEIDALEAELEDRFGAMPEAAQVLLAIARLRAGAHAASIARIDAGPAAIALAPRGKFNGDPDALGLIAKDDRLLLKERIEDPALRLERITELLEALA